MKKITFLFCLISWFSHSQLKGTVTDQSGKPIPFVNIFEENTYNSTVSNEAGNYELKFKSLGNHAIVFQYLGYKTVRKTVLIDSKEQVVPIVMEAEDITLHEVVINTTENPANEIIRRAIRNKKINAEKTASYQADFYSRGIFRIKDAPKKILGQKFDFFDEVLDSTRSGILYLSETVSKITFQKPNQLKEVITASKVSGNDNGFSFNNAASANFDFYDNYVDFDAKMVSPIADNAFNYYRYKLEGSFFTENNQQINKIKVQPRRENEPVWQGTIYIVEESDAIYAVDLTTNGVQIQNPALNTLTLKQNFSYNTTSKIWVKNTQTIDFVAGMLGIKISGRFNHVYSNYQFESKQDKKTFTREILSFENEANKKDSAYWNLTRPVPLTNEETNDYLKKDLLQTKKKSKPYLDSIDQKRNKFKFMDLLSGYTYANSFQKWSIVYDGPIMNSSFNTVQGWNSTIGLKYVTRNEEKRTFSQLGTRIQYGFAENKVRATVAFVHKFNNHNHRTISVDGGSKVAQFNAKNPISNTINTISSLFFKNNFMKLYEKNFVATSYSQELVNGLLMSLNLDYSERKPLWNTTDQAAVKSDDDYSSNNPLLPEDAILPAIDKHNLMKVTVLARINFGQEYWTRPDGKFNIRNEKYPTLYIGYEKTLAATDKKYEYHLLSTRICQEIGLGNKGTFLTNIKAGKFIDGKNISFVDYKHFNGNQTHIGTTDTYIDGFNVLPYYTASTNNRYVEWHSEWNDKGYLTNKIPLLKYLQAQLVIGVHNLAIPNRKPYQEFSVGLDQLGFGKFKLFRIDYVRAYQGGFVNDGVVFGLKFLNIIE